MKIRLADVAASVRVSEATVSRVLNGKPGVAEATRQVVLTALEQAGYERRLHAPPPHAAGLVGLVVPELDNPVFPLLAQAVEKALVRNGYAAVLCTLTAGGVHEDEYVSLLLDRGVAGIIFASGVHAVSTADPLRYQRLRDAGVPIALVNGYLDGVDAPFFSYDEAAAVDLAVAHLAGLGHRSIGLATGPPRYTTVSRRITGFHAAMRRHLRGEVDAAEVDSLVESTVFRGEGGTAAAHALLDRDVTAIVCSSDLMALGAIRAVRDRGLRVPEDVSVVGSDDGRLLEFTDPPLTTVRQPVQAIGAAAVQAIVHEIGGLPAPRAESLFKPELVVRGSTGRPHARPPAAHRATEPASA